MFKSVTAAICLFTAITSTLAHSNMHFPVPRADQSYTFSSSQQNACENESTFIPGENTFSRGQSIDVRWWWNNHRGGFVKFALVKGVEGRVENEFFLRNENIIQGQCYTGACDQNGFDPGNTHDCVGKPLVIPNWVSDGEYVLQWSQIGGYDSDAIGTKQLPLYHTCANIRIQGGNALEGRPDNWIAPFIGGSQDVIDGKQGGDDVCGFKTWNREPTKPEEVNVDANVFLRDMQFGKPGGWAATPGTEGIPKKRSIDDMRMARLGRVARQAAQAAHENA